MSFIEFSVNAGVPGGTVMIVGTPKPIVLASGQSEPTLSQIVEAYRGQVVIVNNIGKAEGSTKS